MTQVRPVTHKKKSNDICVGGCSLNDLATTYGTPLYVLDEQTIRHNCQLFTNVLSEHYPDYIIAYASKAGLNVGIANIIASEGCGADVVSGGELYTVLKSNIAHEKIYFHGNNKSRSELELAIKHHIRIVVDNPHELMCIQSIAEETAVKAKVLFRLKPGIEAHTHEYIKTGQSDSKFGLELDGIIPLIKTVDEGSWADFLGVHAHIGSQIFDVDPYIDLVSILVNVIVRIQKETNVSVTELNCGGGFGIQYIDNDNGIDIPDIITKMSTELKLRCQDHQLPLPKLIFEPGRSIIANAGVTLYSVGAIKTVSKNLTYMFVDGGMADNPRPMMYQSEYTFDVIDPKTDARQVYTIAGKFCESGDILAKQIKLPIVEPNDCIVVYGTGAYNYSMASNYNRFCKPAMVLVNKGQASVIVRRETYNDLIQHDQI